ncbi:hypothetical protein ACIPUD_10905 [Bradyrhizobium sp. CAR08]
MRKHPFHWDVYNRLLDSVARVVDAEDKRLKPEVRTKLTEARARIFEAWDLQATLERAEGARP